MNGNQLKAKFDTEWGEIRKFLSAHPLTGAWLFGAAGLIVGFIIGHIAAS